MARPSLLLLVCCWISATNSLPALGGVAVVVKTVAQFTEEPKDQVVLPGRSFTLPCKTQAEYLNCFWTLRGERLDDALDSDLRRNDDDCSVSVEESDAERHSGEWQCWVVLKDSTVLKSEVATVTVEEPSTVEVNEPEEKPLCLTKACIREAHRILSYMNDTVDPCDDFYEFACGGFLSSTTIPDDKTSMTQFTVVGDVLKKQVRELVEDEVKDDDPEPFKMVKNLFKSCYNKTRIEELDLTELREMLTKLGGWPVLEGDSWKEEDFEWYKSVFNFRKEGYSVDYFFDFSVATDLKNSTRRIVDLDQASLGLSRKYLLKGLKDSDVRAYLDYQVNMAVLLGAEKKKAEEELTRSLEFEILLANISLPSEERRNATSLYNPMTIRELQKRFDFVDWLKYMNTILTPESQVTEDEVVIVDVPSFFTNLSRILEETPKRVMANYVIWRAVKSSVFYMPDYVRNIQLQYSTKLTGKKERKARWEECVGTVKGSLAHAVSSLYVKKHFDEDAKSVAEDMVTYLRSTFREVLNEVDWMDEVTRERALAKASTMEEYIGFPDELLDIDNLVELYDGLEIFPDRFFKNRRQMSIYGTDYAFKRLREPIDKKDWKRHGYAAVVNAYYSAIENSIQFPAGILQGVFFSKDRPMYLNFGAMGAIIGHEITHGFDDQGRQFDEIGNLNQWWEPETNERFKEKAQCIIWQYGNYTVESIDLQLNGINTQGENIADNGGIKESYRAYTKWLSKNGEEPLVPVKDFNQRQMFWISNANVWCSAYRKESLRLRVINGSHPPARFRINGPFSNIPDFARDFNCPPKSHMNPEHRCSVW